MLRASAAKADITPNDDVDLCGFAKRVNPMAGINDPLSTRWLCLENSETRIALGTADIISITRGRFADIQRAAEKAAGVPNAGICFATSHTHSGPATVPLNHCGRMSKPYMTRLMRTLSDTAGKASKNAAPVTIRYAQTQCPGIAINRRDPKAGSVDDTLTTIVFESARTAKPIASIAHFACHPVVLGHENVQVSADYPGFLCAAVEQETNAPCLFLNGACGDINPAEAHSADPRLPRKMGETLARQAIASLRKRSDTVSGDRVRVVTQDIALPVHVPKSADFLKRNAQKASTMFSLDYSLFEDEVAHWSKRLKAGRFPSTITIRTSAMTIGQDIVILFVPGEVFCDIGLQAKAASSFPVTLLSGFSNGSVGYLPTARAYKDGGYEPHVANFFYRFPQLDPKVESTLVTGLKRLLDKAARAARR